MALVDDVGIVQHADGIVLLRSSGYRTDDVARLAIVALGLSRTTGTESYHRMLACSLGFLRHAWSAEERGMRNFMSYERRWLDDPHGGDHLGRAAGAGEVVAAEPVPAVREPSLILLSEMRRRSPSNGRRARWPSPRSASPAPAARCRAARRPACSGPSPVGSASSSAPMTPEWYWAEEALSYDNARIPQALIAGARLGDDEMVREGMRSLEWYAGWSDRRSPRTAGRTSRPRPRRGHPGSGDEQPLDAAALVAAEVEAFVATGEETCARRAVRAFEWFLGRNRLQRSVYDFATGGCHDGLGESDVNRNEGAESTLAYLQALLALDAAGQATLRE